MYAVVKTRYQPGLDICTVDYPKIGEKDVLVKVRVASICGTDVHIWKWSNWAKDRIKKIPLIVGHEFAGEVIETGSSVEKVATGDFVSVESHIVDGTCYQCRMGRMHVCRNLKIFGVDIDGGFTEYVAVPELNAWINDESLPLEFGSIQEPLGNAVHAIFPYDGHEDVSGKKVAVLGCGPIGLMSIAVLKEMDVDKIIASEIAPNRRTLAKEIGADIVVNPIEEDLVDIIDSETDGNGVDLVLEMSGATSAIKQALEIVTPGGRVSLLGLPGEEVSIDLNRHVIFKSARLFGITGRRMFDTWKQVRRLLSIPRFRSNIRKIITHKIPIRDIDKAMELIAKKEAVKVLLEPKW